VRSASPLPRSQHTSEGAFELIEEQLASERSARPLMLAKLVRQVAIQPQSQELAPIAHLREQRRDLDQAIVAAEQVCARAAPRMILGFRYQACTHGVELDVPRGSQGVSLLHREGGESSLPEMAAPAFPQIDGGGVFLMRFADCPAQSFCRIRHGDQMNVIGHEAIRPDVDVEAVARFGQQREIEQVVVWFEERELPAVAALCDVVRQSGNDHAGKASHDTDGSGVV